VFVDIWFGFIVVYHHYATILACYAAEKAVFEWDPTTPVFYPEIYQRWRPDGDGGYRTTEGANEGPRSN